LGGYELPARESFELFEELARIDSAAGWVVANSSSLSFICQGLPPETVDEIFANPDMLGAAAHFPPQPALQTSGGYRLSGRWNFGSGSSHADWLNVMGIASDEKGPRLAPDGSPELIMFFFPREQGEVVENWRTLGMRGTGSHDVRLEELFVPGARSWVVGPFVPGPAFQGPLYRLKAWLAAPLVASVTLGVARAALDELSELARRKTPNMSTTSLAEKPLIQERLARAHALVGAGRAYLHQAIDEAWALVCEGGELGPDEGVPVQLAASYAIEASCQAVDLVHFCAGTSGIRDELPFQRHFRDVHTLSQHAFGSAARFESAGKVLLGQRSDWGFFYL
jgi:alkylation response protein AidB-like acyl-CoA dehydrogenase